jgi:hypothetical protein
MGGLSLRLLRPQLFHIPRGRGRTASMSTDGLLPSQTLRGMYTMVDRLDLSFAFRSCSVLFLYAWIMMYCFTPSRSIISSVWCSPEYPLEHRQLRRQMPPSSDSCYPSELTKHRLGTGRVVAVPTKFRLYPQTQQLQVIYNYTESKNRPASSLPVAVSEFSA